MTVISELLSTFLLLAALSTPTPMIVTVDNTDKLNNVFGQVQTGMRIEVAAGIYELDNPINLDKTGLVIIGLGSNKVRVIAKNAAEPMFVIDADNVTINGLEIDGMLADKKGFAAFGVLVSSGVRDCRISNNVIRRLQATAIVGYDVNNCVVHENVVSEIAADGVRLRGTGIVVTSNFVHTIFDEPLDVYGENSVVQDNRIALGRIGIALGSDGASILSDNLVVEQYEEGIVYDANVDDEISRNIVIDAGIRSYNVTNKSDAGKVAGYDNVACLDGELDPRINVQSAISERVNKGTIDCSAVITDMLPGVKILADSDKPWTKLFVGIDSELTIVNTLDADDKNRNDGLLMAEHLRHFNSGVISIRVDGTTVRSEITSSLARTLMRWPELAVTSVRWPFLRASQIDRWVLRVANRDRLWVTRRHDGSKIRITLLYDEKPTFSGRAVLFYDRARWRLARLMR